MFIRAVGKLLLVEGGQLNAVSIKAVRQGVPLMQ